MKKVSSLKLKSGGSNDSRMVGNTFSMGGRLMQYEVRTMPDGVYVVVADGKTVTQHNSYTDAQRVSDHMNKLAEYKKEQSLLYSTELKSE